MFFFKKNKYPIKLVAKTDIGRERLVNEDAVEATLMYIKNSPYELEYGVLVVADGMGGLEKGEIASETAVKKFIQTVKDAVIRSSQETENINFDDVLLGAVEVANNEVFKISERDPNQIGTTLVGAIITNGKVYIVNVGDSRAYLVHNDHVIDQITKDHSAVQEMYEANIITKEQMRIHPRRNIITRALGLQKDIVPDIFHADFKKNDVLLLCSDGLHSMINDVEIANTINGDISKSAEKLISLANKHGGLDNISVALASPAK